MSATRFAAFSPYPSSSLSCLSWSFRLRTPRPVTRFKTTSPYSKPLTLSGARYPEALDTSTPGKSPFTASKRWLTKPSIWIQEDPSVRMSSVPSRAPSGNPQNRLCRTLKTLLTPGSPHSSSSNHTIWLMLPPKVFGTKWRTSRATGWLGRRSLKWVTLCGPVTCSIVTMHTTLRVFSSMTSLWFHKECWRVFHLRNKQLFTTIPFSAWMTQTSSIFGLLSRLQVPPLMSTKPFRTTTTTLELAWQIPWWTKSPARIQCLTLLWSILCQLYFQPQFGVNM